MLYIVSIICDPNCIQRDPENSEISSLKHWTDEQVQEYYSPLETDWLV